MSNENKEMQLENINKSINSEKLKAINITKSQVITQKRSNSVTNFNKKKNQPVKAKNTNDLIFTIDMKDIIKEASLHKEEGKNKEKPKGINQSKEIPQKQMTSKESPRYFSMKEGDSYLQNTIKRMKTDEFNRQKMQKMQKELDSKEAKDNNTSRKSNNNCNPNIIPQNISKSNPFNKYKGALREWKQMKFPNVYKAGNMNGNLIDYMMIFKKRDNDQYLTNDKLNKPIVIMNKQQDQSPYKIEINLTPKNSNDNDKSKSKSKSKNIQAKSNNTYKAFIPLKIGKIYIEKKDRIIQSILGDKKYHKIFPHHSTIPDNEMNESKEMIERDIDIDEMDKEINITNIVQRNNQKNNALTFDLSSNDLTLKKNPSFYEKYRLIELGLKSTKEIN